MRCVMPQVLVVSACVLLGAVSRTPPCWYPSLLFARLICAMLLCGARSGVEVCWCL